MKSTPSPRGVTGDWFSKATGPKKKWKVIPLRTPSGSNCMPHRPSGGVASQAVGRLFRGTSPRRRRNRSATHPLHNNLNPPNEGPRPLFTPSPRKNPPSDPPEKSIQIAVHSAKQRNLRRSRQKKRSMCGNAQFGIQPTSFI